jgi:hypothetical protein
MIIMDYDKIKYAAFSIYEECNITRLPFNCFGELNKMGYEHVKYSQLNDCKLEACKKLSDDACTIDGVIYYNDKKSRRRIRFSLMHELGHMILKTDSESEANSFASNILAPPMALHYSRLTNIREISNIFDISLEAAKYTKEFYDKWLYSVKNYGMTDLDKRMYDHFFDSYEQKFIFKEEPCVYCGSIIHNSNKPICKECDRPLSNNSLVDYNYDFIVAENSWLYRGL